MGMIGQLFHSFIHSFIHMVVYIHAFIILCMFVFLCVCVPVYPYPDSPHSYWRACSHRTVAGSTGLCQTPGQLNAYTTTHNRSQSQTTQKTAGDATRGQDIHSSQDKTWHAPHSHHSVEILPVLSCQEVSFPLHHDCMSGVNIVFCRLIEIEIDCRGNTPRKIS